MTEAHVHDHQHHHEHAEAAPVEIPAHDGPPTEDEVRAVQVDLTLTSPACPVGPMLQGMIYHKVAQLPNVLDVEVNLVWQPPWDPRTMASEDVKLALGIW